jgi:hypothetical protein
MQVNFFEGGSINNGEMAHVTISQYSSLLCPMVNKKIIHKRYFRIVGQNVKFVKIYPEMTSQ